MSLFVYIEQILWIDVGVSLGRGKAGMAEKFLNRTEIPPTLEEVGGKGVSQSMRAGLCAHRSPDEATGHDSADRSIRNRLGFDSDKQRILTGYSASRQ